MYDYTGTPPLPVSDIADDRTDGSHQHEDMELKNTRKRHAKQLS